MAIMQETSQHGVQPMGASAEFHPLGLLWINHSPWELEGIEGEISSIPPQSTSIPKGNG